MSRTRGFATGTPIEGDYKFIDEFPIAEGFEDVEFLKVVDVVAVEGEAARSQPSISY